MIETVIAQLTLKDSQHWTDEEAEKVSKWLQEKAKQLVAERKMYSKTFRAKYYRLSCPTLINV